VDVGEQQLHAGQAVPLQGKVGRRTASTSQKGSAWELPPTKPRTSRHLSARPTASLSSVGQAAAEAGVSRGSAAFGSLIAPFGSRRT